MDKVWGETPGNAIQPDLPSPGQARLQIGWQSIGWVRNPGAQGHCPRAQSSSGPPRIAVDIAPT